MTNAAVLGSIILLSRTESANHAVGVLIRMIAFGIMTFVAGEHFRAATESEPAVGLPIVGAAAVSGQGLACGDA